MVCECNMHHDDLVFCCFFPLFYKDYLACLIHCHSLYIKMWEEHDNKSLKSFPNLMETFKYLRHLIDFTNRVVDMCLNDVK